MNAGDRIARFEGDLRRFFREMSEFVDRGKCAYDDDLAVRRAVERTAENIGEAIKRLRALDADRFADPAWQHAARFRDFIAHHYEEIDHDIVWRIATVRMPALEAMLDDS